MPVRLFMRMMYSYLLVPFGYLDCSRTNASFGEEERAHKL